MRVGKCDWKTMAAVAAITLGCATQTWASGGEVAVFGGGIAFSGGGGSHGMAGGSVGANVSDKIHIFGEASYVPLGSSNFGGSYSGISVSSKASAKMLQFGGGLQYLFAEKDAKLAPYLTAVAGDARQTFSASSSAAGVSVTSSGSSSTLYVGGGAGLRYSVGSNWGIRPEIRYQRYLQNGGGGAFSFVLGAFFQFGK